MKYCLIGVLLLISISSFSQEKGNAEELYKKGLKAEKEEKFDLCIQFFLAAAKQAEKGTDLELKSVFKSIYYYNSADAGQKSEMIGLTRYLIKSSILPKRTDTLSADIYLRAGTIYRELYQPDSALSFFNSAIKRFDKLYGKGNVHSADCYRGVGEIYESFFYDYNKAEGLYEQSLAIHEKAPPSKVSTFVIGALYAHLVEVNRKQKDFNKMVFYEVKNIPFAELLIANHENYKENAYEGLGITYGDLGQLDRARLYYKKAIDRNHQINNGKSNPWLGSYYESLGALDEKEKLVENAIRNYEKADQIFSSLNDSKSPRYIRTLQRLSALYADKDEVRSLNYLKLALRMITQHGLAKSGQAAELNSSVADYFVSKNKIDSALFYYQKALQSCAKKFMSAQFKDNPVIDDITLKDYAFEVILKKANLLSNQFSVAQKFEYAEAAIQSYSFGEKLLTQSRADLDADRSKWDFFDSNFSLYEQAISLLYELNKTRPSDSLTNQAFGLMESSKSKMLSDALNQAEFADGLIGVDSLVQALNAEKRKLHLLEDQQKKQGTSNQAEINNSMIAADRSIQRIEQQLNEKYPSYLKTKYQNKTPSLKAMQEYALHKHATLIEYFWGAEDVFAIAIDGKTIRQEKIGSVNSIERSIRSMLIYLKEERNDYSKESINSFASNSFELYRILLHPFQQQLANNDHLIIIPDGLLGQLPFEVLNNSESKNPGINYQSLNYLVKTHFVSYSFSSAYLLNTKHSGASTSQLVAFGFTGRQATRSRPNDSNFQEIVGSEEEIKDLAEKFPDGEFFLGKEVTEKRFKEKAPLFDILHLAVHGQGDTEQNYSASLYFRDSLNGGKEDGRLNWYELFDIRLKAQLAVISSCESGIGKAYRGEGMLSMANAFAYAGCRNVVMGLWKVNDNVSVSLMKSFYENIKNGKNVDDALTYAKREYIQNGDEFSSNPKIWASLVTYGNDQVVKSSSTYWIYSIAVIACLAILVFRVRNRARQAKARLLREK